MPHPIIYESRPLQNLRDMLEQSVKLFGSKNAFLIKGTDEIYHGVTYLEFKNDVDCLGTALLALGLKDQFIAVIGENRYEWCVTYLSVANGAGVIVPFDKELPMVDIENLMTVSTASAIIFSGRYEEKVKEATAKVSSVKYYISMDLEEDRDGILSFRKLLRKGKELLATGNRSYLDIPLNAGDLRILLYTSGTTGFSKGVMLSHKNICYNLTEAAKIISFRPSDIALSILPLHHTYECTCGFLFMIYSGCAIAFNEGLKHIAKNLKETGASLLFAVPLIVENMYRKLWENATKEKQTFKLKAAIAVSNFLRMFGIDLRRTIFKSLYAKLGGGLRFILSGAAALDPEATRGFADLGINVVQGYGLTECAPLAILNGDKTNRYGSIGMALPGVEIKIDQPAKDGIGEILINGNNVMLGYFNNEAATEAVLKNNWLYTGDLGYVDEDGFYYITGRKKNVIITKNGKNIYPEELESALNKSPYILESMVWGKEDDHTGEIQVFAQILPRMEYFLEKNSAVTKEEITRIIAAEIKAVNKNTPLYKHIKHFIIRETEFAKTTTQKIKRYAENTDTAASTSL